MGGKVHSSREGPVETAAVPCGFSPNPSSGDQERSAISLLLRGADPAGGGDPVTGATRTRTQAPPGAPARGGDLGASDLTHSSYATREGRAPLQLPPLLAFPFLQFGALVLSS